MATHAIAAAIFVLCFLVHLGAASSTSSAASSDATERWGYVKTRPNANVFWWFYKSPQRVSSAVKPWPTVLWLQGGPGGSSVGRGNFQEIGPLDVNLEPRNLTWLQNADLIFVDHPVGTGYSYVDDPIALVTTDSQAVEDIIELLRVLTKELPTLQQSPLFLVGESYGGKFAAMIGVAVLRANKAGILKVTLGGVVLGDSWVSADDHALSYGQLLHSVSRLDENAVAHTDRLAGIVKEQMLVGQFAAARKTWTDLLDYIDSRTDSVNMQNFLLDSGMNPVLAQGLEESSDSAPNKIVSIMNGIIKDKLKIIPKDLIWQEGSIDVYNALANSFMKPTINEIDELLSSGINVTVYNGQLDVICSSIGTEAWIKKLKWGGLKKFLTLPRQPLYYCDSSDCTKPIKAYVRSYQNLKFYWVLQAGHMVPVDQPYVAFKMISSVIMHES
ncbi:hypothetical protein EJB05_57090 [Eragrostis curvula]|uniref:Carboxypeptidase n=1 Tax=Eragrostis curvula TaxID=38414 RepID=A0A5J9SEB6_9POAL|nr:hypothetical protein EJB05_57090 [Eragrostis curvula]